MRKENVDLMEIKDKMRGLKTIKYVERNNLIPK